MRYRLVALFTLLGAMVAMPVASASASSRAARSHLPPTLELTTAKGYAFAVEGLHWLPRSEVAFSVTANGSTVGIQLDSTVKGRFLIGVSNAVLCGGEAFAARDYNGNRAMILTPGGPCPDIVFPAGPALKVLKGKQVQFGVTRITSRPRTSPVVITIVNAVYMQELGTAAPAYIPSAPDKYFFLIAHGYVPSPTAVCTPVNCGPSAYWEWIGMRVGKTAITMNPSCLPKGCTLPSYLIPVTIMPRVSAHRPA
jgi:hypothetical protein